MATKIVLTVDDGLTAQEVDDLRYLLSDALGEFAARRTPARDYVENRYPGPDYYPDREEKVEQVRRRCAVARKLHNAALGFETPSEKRLKFDMMLSHEMAHREHGNGVDLESLIKALHEVLA